MHLSECLPLLSLVSGLVSSVSSLVFWVDNVRGWGSFSTLTCVFYNSKSFVFKGTVVDNHYGKFIHDNIWYTDAYIHSDNHMYTSPSHAHSHAFTLTYSKSHTPKKHAHTTGSNNCIWIQTRVETSTDFAVPVPDIHYPTDTWILVTFFNPVSLFNY